MKTTTMHPAHRRGPRLRAGSWIRAIRDMQLARAAGGDGCLNFRATREPEALDLLEAIQAYADKLRAESTGRVGQPIWGMLGDLPPQLGRRRANG